MKHHNKKDEQDKELLALWREYLALSAAKRELPYEQLKTPLQRGFKKYFVLRDDISRRDDAVQLQEILGRINHTVYCKDESFKVKKYYNRQKEDLKPGLQYVKETDWVKYKWPDHHKKWFKLQTIYHKLDHRRMITFKAYVFKYPYMFVTKVEPNMVTHIRKFDAELEGKLQGLRNKFDRDMLWTRLDKLLMGSHGGFKEKNTFSYRKEKLQLKEELAEYEE
jgi:hypothetical protein